MFILISLLLTLITQSYAVTQTCTDGTKATKEFEIDDIVLPVENKILGCLSKQNYLNINFNIIFKENKGLSILTIGDTLSISRNIDNKNININIYNKLILIPFDYQLNKPYMIQITYDNKVNIFKFYINEKLVKTETVQESETLRNEVIYISKNNPAVFEIHGVFIFTSNIGDCGNPGPFEPAIVQGDPHFIQFNDYSHSFMGRDGFYYYMRPCLFKGYSNNKEMPFNLIGKHYIFRDRLTSLEYVILQVFDGKNIYSVYARDSEVYYIKNKDKNILPLNKINKIPVNKGQTIKLGDKSVKYTQTADGAKIELKIPGIECSNALEFYIFGESKNKQGQWIEHTLTVLPPDCYKCYTCCLLGDFINKGAKTFNAITGQIISTDTGKYPYEPIAYDANYWGCNVDDTTYTLSPTIKPEKDPCDDESNYNEVEKLCVTEYTTFLNENPECCKLLKDDCDNEIDFCHADTCECITEKTDNFNHNYLINKGIIKQCTKQVIDGLLEDICRLSKLTTNPTPSPTNNPTKKPTTKQPTKSPSNKPTTKNPTKKPTNLPTNKPTTKKPTQSPSKKPTSINPTKIPTNNPTKKPTTLNPTNFPTINPTKKPTTKQPTKSPTNKPTTGYPTIYPTRIPTKKPSNNPTRKPSKFPSETPTNNPTLKPTFNPTINPTKKPTKYPTKQPSNDPTISPTNNPTDNPTKKPSINPTLIPTNNPTDNPTKKPTTKGPTLTPTKYPTKKPTTNNPTLNPTNNPTKKPTKHPTNNPTTKNPTKKPTDNPTSKPTTLNPTKSPTINPTTKNPTKKPTNNPTNKPTENPSKKPTSLSPTKKPSINPTNNPTNIPTKKPTTLKPSLSPTKIPSNIPTINPIQKPTNNPTLKPTTKHPSKSPSIKPETPKKICKIKGQPGVVSGDPHYLTWNGISHNFQGDTDGFYYFIRPCVFDGYNNLKDVPFNLIAKNYIWENTRLKSIEYVVLEVFDGNVRHYIYVQGLEVGYYTSEKNSKRIIKELNEVSLTAIKDGTTKVFNKEYSISFNTVINKDNEKQAIIQLKISSISKYCQTGLQFSVRPQERGENNKPFENAIEIQVPQCYKCKICGLLGDFYNNDKTMYNPITGKIISINTGLPPDYNELAYNDNYWGCKLNDNETSKKYNIYVPPKQPICDTSAEMDKLVDGACRKFIDQYTNKYRPDCCKDKVELCKQQIDSCYADTCEFVELMKEKQRTTKKIEQKARKIVLELMPEVCETIEVEKSDNAAYQPQSLLNKIQSETNNNESQQPTNIKYKIIALLTGIFLFLTLITCISYLLCGSTLFPKSNKHKYNQIPNDYYSSSSDEEN